MAVPISYFCRLSQMSHKPAVSAKISAKIGDFVSISQVIEVLPENVEFVYLAYVYDRASGTKLSIRIDKETNKEFADVYEEEVVDETRIVSVLRLWVVHNANVSLYHVHRYLKSIQGAQKLDLKYNYVSETDVEVDHNVDEIADDIRNIIDKPNYETDAKTLISQSDYEFDDKPNGQRNGTSVDSVFALSDAAIIESMVEYAQYCETNHLSNKIRINSNFESSFHTDISMIVESIKQRYFDVLYEIDRTELMKLMSLVNSILDIDVTNSLFASELTSGDKEIFNYVTDYVRKYDSMPSSKGVPDASVKQSIQLVQTRMWGCIRKPEFCERFIVFLIDNGKMKLYKKYFMDGKYSRECNLRILTDKLLAFDAKFPGRKPSEVKRKYQYYSYLTDEIIDDDEFENDRENPNYEKFQELKLYEEACNLFVIKAKEPLRKQKYRDLVFDIVKSWNPRPISFANYIERRIVKAERKGEMNTKLMNQERCKKSAKIERNEDQDLRDVVEESETEMSDAMFEDSNDFVERVRRLESEHKKLDEMIKDLKKHNLMLESELDLSKKENQVLEQVVGIPDDKMKVCKELIQQRIGKGKLSESDIRKSIEFVKSLMREDMEETTEFVKDGSKESDAKIEMVSEDYDDSYEDDCMLDGPQDDSNCLLI